MNYLQTRLETSYLNTTMLSTTLVFFYVGIVLKFVVTCHCKNPNCIYIVSHFHSHFQNPDQKLQSCLTEHQPLYNTHVKLLAFDILTLTQTDPTSFSRNGVLLSRAEAFGTVISRDLKPGKFLRFTIDDGTAILSCILWLNQLTSPYFSRRNPQDVPLIASTAARFADDVTLGAVARVRGKISSFRGEMQITVTDLVIERDPNAEMLHWVECVRLARKVYNVISPNS